jgi:flavin-dependent dehydrogenase
MAALILARSGVKVRLVERASFPRDKLCGDTLNPGCLALLHRVDRDYGTHLHRSVTERALSIRGMTVTGPDGVSVTADYPSHLAGAALRRRDFDDILLHAAITAGVEFVPSVAVRGPIVADGPPKGGHHGRSVRLQPDSPEGGHDGGRSLRLQPDPPEGGHDGGRNVRLQPDPQRVTGVRVATARGEEDWRARVVIAADGRHSSLAFALGLAAYAREPKRWAFGAYYANVSDAGEHGEMHVRPDGYIGVAPVPGGLVNLCVVRHLHSAGFRMNAEKTLAAAIESDGRLRERFSRARRVSPIATLGPLAVNARAAGCSGLLLAGDAAGFIDPMTGDGLRFALRGAQLAAAAALHELDTGQPAHADLRRARVREFRVKWAVNRALRALVGSPRAVGLATSLSTRWPHPVRFLIAVAGDVPECFPS